MCEAPRRVVEEDGARAVLLGRVADKAKRR